MHQTPTLLAALAEPSRLAALLILRDGAEHSIADLMARLGTTQSRTSRHMAVLRQAGLVTARRDAQWVRYRLNPAMPAPVRTLLHAALALAAAESPAA